jgi:hypothetical protein
MEQTTFQAFGEKMILQIFYVTDPEEDHISRYLLKSFPKHA